MDSLIPSILNEAINERNICSSETLGLREGFFSGAMMLSYLIPNDKFPNVDKSLGPEAAFAFRFGARRMKSTGRAIYFIKDLKEEPAPHFGPSFFRQPAYPEVGSMVNGRCTLARSKVPPSIDEQAQDVSFG